MSVPVRIHPLKISRDGHRIAAEIQLGADLRDVFFSANLPLSPNLEAFMAVALIPAMKNGFSPLMVDGRVDSRFLENLERIQALVINWKPKFKRVQITGAVPQPQNLSGSSRTGIFFSGGVDSFYSLLNNHEQVTDLIFVHGFDHPLTGTKYYARVIANLHQVADHFNLNLIEIDNNIRTVLSKYIYWGMQHGAALAAVSYLLYPEINRFLLPSSMSRLHIFSWGSHPELDPLWSGTDLEIIHDGYPATRQEKVAKLARSEFALQHLRVCFKNPRSGLNCGRCEKCLRTMINLRVVGALDRCTTFEKPLDLRRVARMRVMTPALTFVEQNLAALEADHKDPELAQALRLALKHNINQSKSSQILDRILGKFTQKDRWVASR